MSRPKLAVASDVATIALALAAIGVFGFRFLRRERPTSGSVAELSSDDVRAILESGAILGTPTPKVTIAVFSDYQCPFCKVADERIQRLIRAHPGELAVVVRHLPLEQIHPYARMAASAADCAGRQGSFASFHEALFANQDRLANGTTSLLMALADSVGVADKEAFGKCLGSKESFQRLATDSALGARFQISGTPAILVNNTLILGVPEERQFAQVVERLIEEAR